VKANTLLEPALPLKIVVIEDSDAHAKILKWAFDGLESKPRVIFFSDGEIALANLQNVARSDHLVPDLVLLDLNLPKLGGRQVLRRLKEDPATSGVPVIVISSSSDESDVRAAYELGASTYICKSGILSELRVSLQGILDYWTKLATLPRRI